MSQNYTNQPLHGLPPSDDESSQSSQSSADTNTQAKRPRHPFNYKTLTENPKLYQSFDIEKLPKQAFAGFWPRTIAYLLDLFFVHLFTQIICNLTLFRIFSVDLQNHWTFNFVNLAFIALYFYLTTYYFNGQSFGKMIMGLRVIRRDGQTLDHTTAFIRETAGRLIIYIIPFIALFLIVNDRRQHLVDDWCDTVVVNESQLKMLADLA